MLRGLVTAGLLLSALPAFSQTLDGDWHGTLDAPTGKHLRMLLRFRQDEGAVKAQFMSVDQSGILFSVPLTRDANHLSLTLPRGSSYDATMAADGKAITGSFTSSRITMPLTLTPGSIDVSWVHPVEAGDLTIATPTGPLGGTLVRKSAIGAVILNGSGDANRDGNAMDYGRSTYRILAQALAARDISTLRFDKRDIGESFSPALRAEDITLNSMADDARQVAAELKTRLGARCVWLIGHSEGGVVALLAAQGNADICGLVLLASPGRNFLTILHEQFDRVLPQVDKPAAFAALDALKAGRMPTDAPPQLKMMFLPSLENYYRSQLTIDPTALAAKLKLPMLILQGDADTQISVADARALAQAAPWATLKIEPDLNHSQRIDKDDPGGATPLAPGLADTIADFLKAHR